MKRIGVLLAVLLAVLAAPAHAYLKSDDVTARIQAAWKQDGGGRLDGLAAELLPVVVQSGFTRMVLGYQVFIKGTAPQADRELIVAAIRKVVEPMMKEADGLDPDRLEVNESEVQYR
jgi:hypothetical protein